MHLSLQFAHSLNKIFPDEPFLEKPYKSGSALRGELFHLQLAFYLSDGLRDKFKIEIHSPLKEFIRVYEVRNVPVLLTHYPWSDDYYLRKTPGLYPDLLLPSDGYVTTVSGQWRSLWLETEIPSDYPAGNYSIAVTLTHIDHPECTGTETFTLQIIPAELPKQTLKHTEWFHSDCIAKYYGLDIFSEKYWEYVGNYMQQTHHYGVNMILTPIFTPPLDTEIGGERPTVQLVDVILNNNTYRFGFDRLKRFIDLARQNGIEYFEFSHLFTQWGAKKAVKVIATVDGEYRQLFGWHTDAASTEYIRFLNSFIPALKSFMNTLGLLNNCFFHISDEPSLEQEDSYRSAVNSVQTVLADCNVIDALSDYQFYEKGLIRIPIPSNDRVEEFIEKGVSHRWTYYCCGQVDKVSNRMIAMPSERTRIFGMQLFKYQIEGFLHWGYNFWFNRLSQKNINPFVCTDTEDTYPGGDAFQVYPGENGQPLPSIHQMIFADGLQDMRALQLLSELTSFEDAVKLLDSTMEENITFNIYPHDPIRLLSARETVNQKIASILASKC